MNIILAADESAGLQAFKLIKKCRYNLKAVLCSNEYRNGSSVTEAASAAGYPVFDGRFIKKAEFAGWVRKHHIDILINVTSSYVIHPEILDVLKIGAFNLHMGPLPEYAGLNPTSWAIYNGETEHAVTLHWVNDGIHTGDIVYQTRFPIKETDTGISLYGRCMHYGIPLIQQLLGIAERRPEHIPRKPQNLMRRKYYRKSEVPGNGNINWNLPARRIDALVRASNYYPFTSSWGYPKTSDGFREIEIAKTSVSSNLCISEPGTICYFNGKTAVATAGSWLFIERCIADGKYLPPNQIFKNGQKLGSRYTTA